MHLVTYLTAHMIATLDFRNICVANNVLPRAPALALTPRLASPLFAPHQTRAVGMAHVCCQESVFATSETDEGGASLLSAPCGSPAIRKGVEENQKIVPKIGITKLITSGFDRFNGLKTVIHLQWPIMNCVYDRHFLYIALLFFHWCLIGTAPWALIFYRPLSCTTSDVADVKLHNAFASTSPNILPTFAVERRR